MTRLRCRALAASIVLLSGPAFAADAAKPPATSPPVLHTIAIEVTPEWNAQTGRPTDDQLRIVYNHNFAPGWTWGLSSYVYQRTTGTHQTAIETTIGYTFAHSTAVSFPVSIGIGGVDDQVAAGEELSAHSWGFYSAYAGMNVKLGPTWTWNVFNARWRNAFQGGWATPKITTGLTHVINAQNSVYANLGYSWKNGDPEKISFTVAYRYGF
jgi:hypothetical protein